MYKKIDIYFKKPCGNWVYDCSTNQSKTCKEAVEKRSRLIGVAKWQLKAWFSK